MGCGEMGRRKECDALEQGVFFYRGRRMRRMRSEEGNWKLNLPVGKEREVVAI